MKKWVLLSLLFPLVASAGEPIAPPMGPLTNVLYKLEDRFCTDGMVPTDAMFQAPGNVGLVFGDKQKLTIHAQIDLNNSVDVRYNVKGSRFLIIGDPQGGLHQIANYRVRERYLTIILPVASSVCRSGKTISQFWTDGQNVNNPIANTINTGFPYDLDWTFETSIGDSGYTLSYVGFKTAEPTIVAIDQAQMEAKDGITMIKKFAERASRCVDVVVNDAAKTVTVKPRSLIYVDSKHIENSTYSVDGKPAFSLETNNEQRERYFCILRPDMIEAEWQKKAFADYLKGPFIPSILNR